MNARRKSFVVVKTPLPVKKIKNRYYQVRKNHAFASSNDWVAFVKSEIHYKILSQKTVLYFFITFFFNWFTQYKAWKVTVYYSWQINFLEKVSYSESRTQFWRRIAPDLHKDPEVQVKQHNRNHQTFKLKLSLKLGR